MFSAQNPQSHISKRKKKVNAFLTGNDLSVLALHVSSSFCLFYSSWISAMGRRCQLITNEKVREIRNQKQLNRLPDLTFISMLFSSTEPLVKDRLISFSFYAVRRRAENPFDILILFSYIVSGYLVFLREILIVPFNSVRS